MRTQGFFFFFDNRGVRVSLRAPQLIPGLTEHPTSPSEHVRHRGGDRRTQVGLEP